MRFSLLSALGLSVILGAGGCYSRHEPFESSDAGLSDAGLPDAGVSPFVGIWLVDQPFHARYEATIYELAPDGRFIERCGFGGTPEPTAFVERATDGMQCELVGPWTNRLETALVVRGYCDDSVYRTVVLDVAWEGDRPSSVTIQKVDGETEGWTHPEYEWRWLPCALADGECDFCE